MDVLKQQLQRIQSQLNGLSASQKMLTASLVAIMVMTILWWARYAGTSEMAPVLDQTLTPAQMGQIKTTLDAHGINARIVGDRVMVPVDRKAEALVTLSYDDAMPDNATNVWDTVMQQMSPWDPRSKTDSIQNHLKEQLLNQAMAKFIPGVASANVFINPVSERRVGASLEPSASIQITTRGRNADFKRIAEGAAMTVAHAVSGLTRDNVSVLVNGMPIRVNSPGNGIMTSDRYELIDGEEKRVGDKIRGLLMGIPGALVAVTVDLDATSREQVAEAYDKDNTIKLERIIEVDTTDNQQPVPQAGDPGMVSNTGLTLGTSAPQATASNTSEKSHTEMENFPGKTVTRSNTPAGKATVLSAAVRLPRSYFVGKFKAMNPEAKDPDDAVLQPLVKAELPGIQKFVMTCATLKNEDSVSVDMYYDGALPAMPPAAEAGVSSGMTAVVGGHVKEIALGALAVLSLFMVSMIVKKGVPAPTVAAGAEMRETPHLVGGESLAGIVGDGTTTLDGMELDDDALKSQQMVEQVSTMVKENPDAAANLVKRWLNRA